MASVVPNDTKKLLLDRLIAGKTFKLSLHTSDFTPNKDTMTYKSDLTNEITGGGYTAGGYVLDSVATAVDDTNDIAYVDAADEVVATLTNTFRYGVICDTTSGVDSTSPIVAIIDYGADISPYNDTFTHQFAVDGWLKITE